MADSTKSSIPPRIFLWCVPRSCSTVFTKFMSYVDGAEIWFEPYNFCWIRKVDWINSIEKKGVSDGFKQIIDEVNSISEKDLGCMKKFESYSYESIKAELEGEPRNANAKFIFVKDMAYGIHGCYKYLPEKVPCKHVFLIRHPHRYLLSYRKHQRRLVGCLPEEEYKHGESDLLLCGGKYKDQIFELWKHIKGNVDPNPVVMDADDMLENPEIILPKLFERLNIPWKDSYLTFPGNKSALNKWIACYEEFDERITAGTFDRAFNTTHFIPMEEPVPTRQEMHPDIAKFIDKFMPGYEEMRKYVISK